MSLQEEIIAQLGVKPNIDPEEENPQVGGLSQGLSEEAPFFEKLCSGNFWWSGLNFGWSLGSDGCRGNAD